MTTKTSNAGQGLAIAGLVLGIISLVISFIPCLGMYAIFPGVVAIVLSAVGLAQANRENAAKGLAIAALVISILGTSIAAWQYIMIRSASDQIEKGVEEFQQGFKDALEDLDKEGAFDDIEGALDELENTLDDIEDEIDKAVDEVNSELEDDLDQLENENDQE